MRPEVRFLQNPFQTFLKELSDRQISMIVFNYDELVREQLTIFKHVMLLIGEDTFNEWFKALLTEGVQKHMSYSQFYDHVELSLKSKDSLSDVDSNIKAILLNCVKMVSGFISLMSYVFNYKVGKLEIDTLNLEYSNWVNNNGFGKNDKGLRFGQYIWNKYNLHNYIQESEKDGYNEEDVKEAFIQLETLLENLENNV